MLFSLGEYDRRSGAAAAILLIKGLPGLLEAVWPRVSKKPAEGRQRRGTGSPGSLVAPSA